MWLKNILQNSLAAILFVVIVVQIVTAGEHTSPLEQHMTRINIIYPKPGQILSAVDSTFILGNVPAEQKKLSYKVFINGYYTEVHPSGGFIAFIPIEPGDFDFNIEAYLVDIKKYEFLNASSSIADIDSIDVVNRLSYSLPVIIPQPLEPISFDSLVIDSGYSNMFGHNIMRSGDRLQVTFKGTPGCYGWFSIPGLVDSVAMSESAPRLQPYWGEAVFGAGGVPDSLMVDGIYSGFLDIKDNMICDSTNIMFHLKPPTPRDYIYKFSNPPYNEDDMNLLKFLVYNDSDKVEQASPFTISLNDPEYPFTVQFVDSVQIIRHGPRRGYFSIFQPEGVQVLVVGKEQDWYIAQLSATQKAWIHENSVEILEEGILPVQSFLSVVRMKSDKESMKLEFPLSGKHPYKIIEDDRRTIRIQLFGVTSDTDWIRYDFSDPLVELATWNQIEPGFYELKIVLSENIWGYDTYYLGNTFYFQLNKIPENLKRIKGKTIVIDPGHASDKGSIGATGYTEAEANLGIALALKKKLISKGARVVMTRDDMSHVDLYDRPAIAKINDADLFVSVHNNALPDGVNPFANNGSSTYYYHPHSIALARAVQKELIKATKLGDYGLYHGNLAVNRPNQYPAILVECAFMILPEHEALLKTDKFRKKVASAITKGIERFLKDFNDDD